MILYTNHCSKCEVLKMKLQQKNIPFTICDDLGIMTGKGLRSVPHLELENGDIMDFVKSIRWLEEN